MKQWTSGNQIQAARVELASQRAARLAERLAREPQEIVLEATEIGLAVIEARRIKPPRAPRRR